MNEIMLEFDTELLRNNYMLESGLDNFSDACQRINLIANSSDCCLESTEIEDMYTEAGETFLSKIKEFFTRIINAIKEFGKKVRLNIQTKMLQYQVNKKMAEIKKMIAKGVFRLDPNQKIGYIPSKLLMKDVTAFINTGVALCKNISSKDYKNYDEFVKECNEYGKKLDKIAESFTDAEKYILSVSTIEFVKLYDAEEKNFDKFIKYMQETTVNAEKDLQKEAEKCDDASKIGYITSVANKLANVNKKIVGFMHKHSIITGALTVITISGAQNRITTGGRIAQATLPIVGMSAMNIAANRYDKRNTPNVEEDRKIY